MVKYLVCKVNRCERLDTLGSRIELADGFFQRLRGLLGRSVIEEGEGMLLSPCSSIHCWGMKFPIDVVFLDRDYRIVQLKSHMSPGSMASSRKSRFTLELKAGEIKRHGIEIGHKLEFSLIEK